MPGLFSSRGMPRKGCNARLSRRTTTRCSTLTLRAAKSMLWSPASLTVADDTIYAFTSASAAFAIHLLRP